MKTLMIGSVVLLAALAVSFADDAGKGSAGRLTIRWQRLVCENEKTCERCSTTQVGVRKGHELLSKALKTLDIEVTLDEKVVDEKQFAGNPQESNRVVIGEKTLEEWLGAKTGRSSCVTCSKITGKDVKCRTIKFGGKTYESIPANLVVKAGLAAAAQLLAVEPDKGCCGNETPGHQPCSTCPKRK